MIMKEKILDSMIPDQGLATEEATLPDEFWENCKGQCGYTPWCKDCLLQKEQLQKESLNREGCSDDKKG